LRTRIIAVANQKGGVGKTTSVVNLGVALSKRKRKTLLVDIDPQANLSYHLLGAKVTELEACIYDTLKGERTPETLLIPQNEHLDVLPSGLSLSGAEVEFSSTPGREKLLAQQLNPLNNQYNYVLIDCPPSLGLLTLNALVTAKEVFIPLEAEFFALQGLSQLLQTVRVINERLNSELEITGVILCKYDRRRKLTREVEARIRKYFEDKAFNTVIRENVSLAEAPSAAQSIFDYAPSSHGARDYSRLAKEVIDHE